MPKVLHEVCGRPMLRYALGGCVLAGVDRLLVVVGSGADQVRRKFESNSQVEWIEQTEQKGTGHAVQCCREALNHFKGNVLVLAGDMPLVRRETLASLIEMRENSGDALVMATTVLDDPAGYGRILRDDSGAMTGIVEHADCTAEQRDIREVNPSYYCFDAQKLFEALQKIKPSGPKSEYYLTDVVGSLRDSGSVVSAPVKVAAEDARGINSRLDLALINRIMQDRIQLSLMNEGVTIVDPDNTWIESDVTVGVETVVYPFTVIGAGAVIGERCRIGPFANVGVGQTLVDGSAVCPEKTDGVSG